MYCNPLNKEDQIGILFVFFLIEISMNFKNKNIFI